MVVAAIVGAVCAAVGAGIAHAMMSARVAAGRAALAGKEDELATAKTAAEEERRRQSDQYREQIGGLEKRLDESAARLAAAQAQIGDMKAAAARDAESLAAERKRLAEQQRHYDETLAKAEDRFRTLAQRILEERSEKLKTEGEAGMRTIADGLAKDIRDFRERLERVSRDATERSGKMDERILGLVAQTNAITAQANNLAEAIRGDAQVTGAWGEQTLKRVLELAGFSETIDYSYQESFADDGTGRKSRRTDFTIKMTGGRQLVIDAKNTVASLMELHEAEDGERRERLVDAVLQSVRDHVDEIVKAGYQRVVPDAFPMVLMYIPIEEVYLLALKGAVSVGGERRNLREYAAEKGVVFVNATSVVPIVRIVEMLWEMERSERNREELTQTAQELLQRIVDFAEHFEDVGSALDKARGCYDAARVKIIDAPGGQSIKKSAERFLKLGVKLRKRGGRPRELPKLLAEEASE